MSSYIILSALKYSERRAFHCRIDAEHNSSPTARLSSADPSQCNVSVEEVGRFFIITSNGLPDHEVHSKKIKSQNIELSIPKVPTIMKVRNIFFLNSGPIPRKLFPEIFLYELLRHLRGVLVLLNSY